MLPSSGGVVNKSRVMRNKKGKHNVAQKAKNGNLRATILKSQRD